MARRSSRGGGFGDLRRRLGRVAPEARKQLDRDVRGVGRGVAQLAADNSVKRTGKFSRSWTVGVLARGVVIRNKSPQAQQQEGGAKIWLRRGMPYPKPAGPGPSTAVGRHGILPVRQVSVGGGKVVNEAQILIRRSAPGRRAVDQELPRSRAKVAAHARAAVVRALG